MEWGDFNLSDGELNDYFTQMQREGEGDEYDSKNELQTLIQNTLHLEYDIFLSEEELKMYKVILTEKQCEVKRLKDKLTKKNGKVNFLNDNLKKLGAKIQQIKEGYKKINHHNKQGKLAEQTQRSERLVFQQKKTKLYQTYCELEKSYSNLLLEVDDYGEIEQQYNDLKSENEEMQKQIDDFLDRKRQINSDEVIDRKEHLKNEVKKMYEKIKMTEKEDESICQQYEMNRRSLNELQKTQNTINHKNVEIENLYRRIDKVKEDIKLKRWEKTEKQREFFQVSREETELRKEMNAEVDYRDNQRKIKERLNHNFKIIDSEADEEFTKTGEKLINHYQSCNLESQEQLDQLINRFQKIKSKSKNI